MRNKPSSTDKIRAQSLNRTGLEHYERWELESAITLFQEAARLNPEEPDYHLNLARAQVRMGDYEQMLLTSVMPQEGIPLEIVGAAIQMWVEYRVTIGKSHLDVSIPQNWAAALDYTVRKVNFKEASLEEIAQWYNCQEQAIRYGHQELVKALDVMPCDYRYFRGEENPLDKLVEAAMMLEELEERFKAV